MPVTQPDQISTDKKNRGGGSFVWKITLLQTLRTFWLFVLVNVLITLLF